MPGVSSRVKVSSKAPDGAVGPVRGSSRMALWGVDGFFSFAELCRVSLVTRTPAKERVDPLYGKMKTPVGADAAGGGAGDGGDAEESAPL